MQEIAASSQALARTEVGSERQACAIGAVTAVTKKISITAQQIAANAGDMSNLAIEAEQVTIGGKLEVEQVITQIGNVGNRIEAIS